MTMGLLKSDESKRLVDYEALPGRTIGPGTAVRYSGYAFLSKLKCERAKCYRVPWDVSASPDFLSDYSLLSDEMKECVIQNVAALIHAKWPNTFGEHEAGWFVLEIGHQFRIVYNFSHYDHAILLLFVRKKDGAYDGLPRVNLPRLDKWSDDPDFEFALEGYESILAESYERDIVGDILARKLHVGH